MRIVMIAASSLDGKISQWDKPGVVGWNSDEDKQYFADLISHASLSIMGSGTYEVIRGTIANSSEKLRVILTSTPEKYHSERVEGQLEFWNATPTAAIEKLAQLGYTEALLLGGSEVHGSFLAAGLVNEIWLTLEPKIFGTGKSLAGVSRLEVNLRLLEQAQLNGNGTLLLKYEVL